MLIFFKNTKAYLDIILTKILNQSLEPGNLPDDWKINKLVPLYKSCCRHLLGNCSPISLTTICCKIIEHVIFSHLTNIIESFCILLPVQHRFRKEFSCETQLATFTNGMHCVLYLTSEVDCIFLYFCKTFDRVSHQLLLYKLHCLNIDPNV